ncbi:hypothetical protein R5R35_012019 [Gryllus longicercus]|uniref:Senescence domain-containing protein n=1 Tax=Gryllus longicercus TaxID=2509291 RepID=A0AAN9W7G9_9ORTH
MERIEPKEKPATISPKVESGIKVAKNVSKGAANVTSYIVSQIDHASHAVGHYLAPRIHSKGTQLLSVTFKYSEEKASKKVDNAFLVAAGAVGGVITVFGGLVNAGGILAQSLSTNTVKIVEHKYGEPAGAVAGDTINVAGNIFVAGSNLMHLTPHGLLEVAAAEITMGVVEDHRAVLEHSLENKHSMAGSSSKID